MSCTDRPESRSTVFSGEESFSVREARRLFNHYCSPCHGENGDGFGKYFAYDLEPRPPDFTVPDFLQNRGVEELTTLVTKGSAALGKSNLCPPWEKTILQEEILYLVTHIKILNEGISSQDSSGVE